MAEPNRYSERLTVRMMVCLRGSNVNHQWSSFVTPWPKINFYQQNHQFSNNADIRRTTSKLKSAISTKSHHFFVRTASLRIVSTTHCMENATSGKMRMYGVRSLWQSSKSLPVWFHLWCAQTSRDTWKSRGGSKQNQVAIVVEIASICLQIQLSAEGWQGTFFFCSRM